jgi:uncharacterized coiled-coil protein SlyX
MRLKGPFVTAFPRGWAFAFLGVAACLQLAVPAIAQDTVDELRRRLDERDAQIQDMRQQMDALTRRLETLERQAQGAPAPSPAPTEGRRLGRPEPTEEAARALERELVRRGALVVPRGTLEVEPELSYTYSEPVTATRRDTFSAALTLRYGLPWDLQAETRIPYVISSRQEGFSHTSDLGDIEVALTKQVLTEEDWIPGLLVSGRWIAPTGDFELGSRNIPTGTGADALQATVTAVKTHDPLVLFGRGSYTTFVSSDGVDWGDIIGLRLGTSLAASPETSLFFDFDIASSSAAHINGREFPETNRVAAIFEAGIGTIVARDTLLNISGAIGLTDATPDFRLLLSLPTRF